MRLVLIRHGESVGNSKKGYISGASDTEGLTTTGKSQVIRTAWELSEAAIYPTVIFTSPVQRARDTALILSQTFGVNTQEMTLIAELNHGVLEGHYWWEMSNTLSQEWREAFMNDFTTPYPGGESFFDLALRVKRALEFLLKLPEGNTIFIVAHDAVIGTALYLLTESSFALPTDSSLFMSFLRRHVVPNAGAILLIGQDKSFTEQGRFSPTTAVDTTFKTYSFYIQALGIVSRPFNLIKMPSVSINSVFHLSIEDHENDFVLKTVNQAESIRADRLKKIYTFLEKKAIQAPVIHHLDASGIFFEKPTIISDFTPGLTQMECIQSHPHPQVKRVFHEIKAYLDSIHSLPVDEVRRFWDLTPTSSWSEYMQGELEETCRVIPQLSLSEQMTAFIDNTFHLLKHYWMDNDYPVVPLHGDVSPQNVLLSDTVPCNFISMLDFERARLGDRVWDFAYYYGWLERLSSEAASIWKEIIFTTLDKHDKEIFLYYRLLFHVWTLRDTLTYPHDDMRQEAGVISRNILLAEPLAS